MDYTKCGNYPRCTLTECECHQQRIFKELIDKRRKHRKEVGETLLRFEIIDGTLTPIFENKKS